MTQNIVEKLIEPHLVEGRMRAGDDFAIRIDQTLMPDTGDPTVFAAMKVSGAERISTEVSAQYVDHNLLQIGPENANDQAYMRSMCARLGVYFSEPGNGISHCVHFARFGAPGKTLAGADSHTPSAGAMGMFAVGIGGLELATVLAGAPLYLRYPKVVHVRLENALPAWVSAKDVVLEMLRRNGTAHLAGAVVEYGGPGVAVLSCMDRHVIANMGTELGALTSVFPSDAETLRYLTLQGRQDDWIALAADDGARYDESLTIDLAQLEPLIALPGSPANVVPVTEVCGRPVRQVVIGSSANSGLRDYVVAAGILAHGHTAAGTHLDVNPPSRQTLLNMTKTGALANLMNAGASIHQSGCLGCVGIGQSIAPGEISLRTMPRNFRGRSGTADDAVYLCSPETAAAAALRGVITDPRELERTSGMAYPRYVPLTPEEYIRSVDLLHDPSELVAETAGERFAGSRAGSLPPLEPMPDEMALTIAMQVGDDVTTDEILPGGERTLSLRSNLRAISRFVFANTDPGYVARAEAIEQGHVFIAGRNYGQGSSREQAAGAPRYLGLRVLLAVSYARIHYSNLINFGVLPLHLLEPVALEELGIGGEILVSGIHAALDEPDGAPLVRTARGVQIPVELRLRARERRILRAGGLLNSVVTADAV